MHTRVSEFSTSWTAQTSSSGFFRAEVTGTKGQQILECKQVQFMKYFVFKVQVWPFF